MGQTFLTLGLASDNTGILITTFMDHFVSFSLKTVHILKSRAVAAGQLDARNRAMSGDEITGQTALFLLAGSRGM
jgi:hypothetical protein